MVVFTQLGYGEHDELEQLLFAEEDTSISKTIEVDKCFSSRYAAIGASIFLVVDFDVSDYGKKQFVLFKKGSEEARDKGLGQIVPEIIDQTHDFYREDRISTILDSDSYSVEKLITLGYVATNSIPDGYQIEFVDVEPDKSAQIIDLPVKNTSFDRVSYPDISNAG